MKMEVKRRVKKLVRGKKKELNESAEVPRKKTQNMTNKKNPKT